MRIFRMLIPIGLVLGALAAQTPAANLEFEVVSIKPAMGARRRPAKRRRNARGWRQLYMARYAMKILIAIGYNLKSY
jgi:hypothetical protein